MEIIQCKRHHKINCIGCHGTLYEFQVEFMSKTLYYFGNSSGLMTFLDNIARDKRITQEVLMTVTN